MVSDPLKNLPAQEKMLFEMFTRYSTGFNLDAVMGAAVNVLINAIRMAYPKRDGAEAKMSELFGRGMQMLLHNHYDSTTGLRRNVFPHTQIVRMAYHFDDDKHGSGNGQ
jgi:hypothetical protein